MKYLVMAFALFMGAAAWSSEPCQVEEPEMLYVYQDRILEAAKTAREPEVLQQQMAEPLKCLIDTYKNSKGLLMKYVAGSCLQRLMGGAEIKGFKRGWNYEIVFNSLINQQLASGPILSKSEIADFASGKWADYVDFCKGSVTDAMCSDLLPTVDKIKSQNELLGATSMLVLKSAYNQFSGATKRKIARQITQLYKETSKESPLKRRVIEQIYREMKQSRLELRRS